MVDIERAETTIRIISLSVETEVEQFVDIDENQRERLRQNIEEDEKYNPVRYECQG